MSDKEPRWLTEKELAWLMTQTSYTQVLGCSFGPHGVMLRRTPENQWAFDALDRRAETMIEYRAMLAMVESQP